MTSAPPQADEQTRAQIADAAAKDPQGQHQGGEAAPKVKTEKECTFPPKFILDITLEPAIIF